MLVCARFPTRGAQLRGIKLTGIFTKKIKRREDVYLHKKLCNGPRSLFNWRKRGQRGLCQAAFQGTGLSLVQSVSLASSPPQSSARARRNPGHVGDRPAPYPPASAFLPLLCSSCWAPLWHSKCSFSKGSVMYYFTAKMCCFFFFTFLPVGAELSGQGRR